MSPVPDPASALADVVHEVEAHASRSGWDRPAQLFALVETAELLQREPHLAEVLGVEAQDHDLTPVEQNSVNSPDESVGIALLSQPRKRGALTDWPDCRRPP